MTQTTKLSSVTLAAFADEIEKIAAARRISDRFGLEKIASEADLIEKLAQLEVAHRLGQISDQEKEAGIALAKGLWGATRAGAGALRTGLGQLGTRMGKAYAGAAGQSMRALPGASNIRHMAAGALGAGKSMMRGAGGVMSNVGQAMKGGFGTSYNAAKAATKPVGTMGKVLGTAAVLTPAAAAAGYGMGRGSQPQAGY